MDFMDFLFREIFNVQTRCFGNEYEAISYFARGELSGARRDVGAKFLECLRSEDPPSERIATSESFRQQGNKLFKASTKNALDAARLFTKAIFAAPLGSEALALAHANRAVALQKFGYYSQAYDDCVCALEQGYPFNMQHKIIMRQAFCALNLKDVTLMKQHLEKLKTMDLNKNFTAEMIKLEQSLLELELKKQPTSDPEHRQIALYRDKVKIMKSPTKGRYMVATKTIEKNELIFSDRASSFVPFNNEYRICQQCTVSQLIPFPCYRCGGKVVYCSLNCKKAHQNTHKYECKGYQIGLFPCDLIESYLGIRMFLEGIQQVLPFLRSLRTSKDIWLELTDENRDLLQQIHLEYVQVLRRPTNFEKIPQAFIIEMARTSVFMLAYLSMLTDFIEGLVNETDVTTDTWEIVIGCLILRHSCQNTTHAHQVGNLIMGTLYPDPLEFDLMNGRLWDSPLHIRRGYLHQKLTISDTSFLASYSYFELLNHSCEPSVKTKLTGRHISTFAIKKIKPTEEITANYERMGDEPKQFIKEYFRRRYHFDCNCSKCKQEGQEEIDQFNQFRCENSKCRLTFTASEYYVSGLDVAHLRCTGCNTLQCDLIACLVQIEYHLGSMEKGASRNRVFQHHKELDLWLLYNNRLKWVVTNDIIGSCLKAHTGGAHLTKREFTILNNMCKITLRFANEVRKKDFYYAITIANVWDLIALGKYKYKNEELQEMLETIDTLAEEFKIILVNYYDDFISTKVKP